MLMLLLGFGTSNAQVRILYETDGTNVKLRWQGVHTPGIPSYQVYRKQDGGPWEKLTSKPLQPILNYDDLKEALKFKTDAYLQLFGLSGERLESINTMSWDSTFAKKGAESFIGALSLVNPEYAVALGEVFTDNPPDKSVVYSYKVTYANSATTEKDLAVIENLKPSLIMEVPGVNELKAVPGNASVKLEWRKDKELLKKGSLVSFRIYKSSDILGPYESVNFYGTLSFTIQSSGKTFNENTESYTVEFLQNGTPAYFMVRGVNAFGTESKGGVTVSATPFDPALHSAPKSLKVEMRTGMSRLSWDGNKRVAVFRTDSRRKAYEQIYPPKGAVLKEQSEWFDASVAEGKEYWYTARTIDESGAIGSEGDTVYLFVPDITPPAMPSNVKAVAKKGLIALTWDANKEPDILGYEIERSSDKSLHMRMLLTRRPISALIWRDTLDYKSQTKFGYIVYAVDKNYNRSKPSQMTIARMPDFDPPAKPLLITVEDVDTNIKLTWIAPPDKDIAAYRVYRSTIQPSTPWTRVAEVKGLTYTDHVSSGDFLYSIVAVDSAGNESELSVAQRILVRDNKALRPPVNGRADTSGGSVILHWSPAPRSQSQGWVITRIIEGKATDIAQLESGATTYEDLWPVKGIIIYEIRSRNADWQMGPPLRIEINYTR